MEKELKLVIKKLNELSEHYNCRIDISSYEVMKLGKKNIQYIYKAEAIRPEEKIAEA